MGNMERGMMAYSRAGHDCGQLYVIWDVQGEYVYLVDGRLKPIDKPKKKKIMHIQIIRRIPEELTGKDANEIKNEDIRRVIRRISNV